MISAVACLAALPVGCAGAGDAPSVEPDAAPAEDSDGDEEAALRRKISRGGLGLVRARGRLAELLASRLPRDDDGRQLSTSELESLQEIVGLDPSRQVERLRLGRALLALGKYTAALEVLEGDAACEACVALRPAAYLNQGLLALAADDGEAAAVAFERSFALDARPEPLLHRARIYGTLAQGSADDAVYALQRALAFEPFAPRVAKHYQELLTSVAVRAALDGRSGTVEQALLLFPRKAPAVKRVTDELVLRASIGAAELIAGDLRESRERHRVLSEDLLSFPEDADAVVEFTARVETAFIGLALAQSEQGRPEIGREVLEAGLMLAGNSDRLELHLLMLDSRGDPGRGLKRLANLKAARSDEGQRARAELLAARALQYVRDGKVRAAARDVKAALKIDPDLASARLANAHVLAASRVPGLSYKSAQDALKRGLVSYPEGRVMRYAEALVEVSLARHLSRSGSYSALGELLTPSLADRIFFLESELRAYVPLEVAPSVDGLARLQLRHPGDAPVTVRVSVDRGRYREVEVLPGVGTSLELEEGGVVRIDDGQAPVSIVAEPGTVIVATL